MSDVGTEIGSAAVSGVIRAMLIAAAGVAVIVGGVVFIAAKPRRTRANPRRTKRRKAHR